MGGESSVHDFSYEFLEISRGAVLDCESEDREVSICFYKKNTLKRSLDFSFEDYIEKNSDGNSPLFGGELLLLTSGSTSYLLTVNFELKALRALKLVRLGETDYYASSNEAYHSCNERVISSLVGLKNKES